MPEPEKRVVLVVDDDRDVAEMISAYLAVHGYTVQSVGMGEAAVQTALCNPPDLVIQDINLPDIDGFEVAYRLRNNRKTKDIPIIFLTEKRARSDRLQGLELGADDYITKPFDIQELRLRVRNAMRRVDQGTLTNPITGLPEGVLVDDRLEECLRASQQVNWHVSRQVSWQVSQQASLQTSRQARLPTEPWALLLVSLENLSRYREHYGFVAADDVLRAVTLMIHNAIREAGGVNDFVGHFSADEFIIVTTPLHHAALAERIKNRLEQSLEYFYPLRDRERKRYQPERLAVLLRMLSAERGPFANLVEMKTRLIKAGFLE